MFFPYHIAIIFESIISAEKDQGAYDSKVAKILELMNDDGNIGSPNDTLLFNELVFSINKNEAHRMLALYLIWLYDYQVSHAVKEE